jgi:thymidylate kinase
MLQLLAHLADYWLGYWVAVRPVVARTGLVIFDRYFDDVIADPVRYRYGGPLWWPRLLRRLTPRPDLLFILDAPEEIVLARKRECEPEQLRMQRQSYLRLAAGDARARVIASGNPPQSVVNQCMESIVALLNQRLRNRNQNWFGVKA